MKDRMRSEVNENEKNNKKDKAAKFIKSVNSMKSKQIVKIQFQNNYQKFLAIALRYLKSMPEAEDAVSAVMERSLRIDFNNIDFPRKYINRMVVNECYNRIRQKNRIDQNLSLDDDRINIEPPPTLPYDDSSPPVHTERLFSCLTKRQKAAFRLYLLNYPHKEIAEELGIAVGRSRNLVSQAKRRLNEVFHYILNSKDDDGDDDGPSGMKMPLPKESKAEFKKLAQKMRRFRGRNTDQKKQMFFLEELLRQLLQKELLEDFEEQMMESADAPEQDSSIRIVFVQHDDTDIDFDDLLKPLLKQKPGKKEMVIHIEGPVSERLLDGSPSFVMALIERLEEIFMEASDLHWAEKLEAYRAYYNWLCLYVTAMGKIAKKGLEDLILGSESWSAQSYLADALLYQKLKSDCRSKVLYYDDERIKAAVLYADGNYPTGQLFKWDLPEIVNSDHIFMSCKNDNPFLRKIKKRTMPNQHKKNSHSIKDRILLNTELVACMERKQQESG